MPTIRVDILEVRLGAPEWATDIIKYLNADKLHDDKWEGRKIKNRVSRFILIDGVLYKWGYFVPLLWCVSLEQAQYVLAEVHEGMCGNHS